VFTLPFEFTHATAIRPPLYPTVVAAAMRIFGEHVATAQGVNIAVGSAAAVLGALLAARIAGVRAGLAAGGVIALYPPLIANDVTILVESFAVLLCLASVLLLLDGRTVWAGAALGLLMLDRASAQWLVLVFGVWVVRRFGWRHALVFAGTALVVVSPWVARNWVDVGGPTLVTTNGYNLNATYSAEAVRGDGFVDAYFDSRFANIRAAAPDEVALDTALRNHALHQLRRHPGDALRVAGNGLLQWFELQPAWNTDAERLDGRNLGVRAWTLPLFYLVTTAGIAGFVIARRSYAGRLAALTAGYFTAVCVVSIAVPRLRSVFDAMMAVGAGVTIAWLTGRRTAVTTAAPAARPLRARRAAGALVAIAVVVASIGFVWRHRTQESARHAVAAAITRDLPATRRVESALEAAQGSTLPPDIANADIARLHDLVTVLGDATPEATSGLRDALEPALAATRALTHQTDVVALLSAAEVIEAGAHRTTPDLARVAARYEQSVRPKDPTLPPLPIVLSGATVRQAQDAIAAVRHALG